MTIKQENFCLAYIETGNASEAYRRAYNAGKMKDVTTAKRASELLANGDVAGRIAELRKPVLMAAQITLELHLSDLKTLRDKANDEGKYAAAVQAEIARGKASGLYVEKLVHSGTIVKVVEEAPKLSKEEWLKAHGLGSKAGHIK